MTVKDILNDTEVKMKKTIEAVAREFSEIRTGRASPSLVQGIRIDYYDTPTLLKQLASISVPDAHLIVIQPWDPTIITQVEKAILKSELGLTPTNDGKLIRLAIPRLSEERRNDPQDLECLIEHGGEPFPLIGVQLHYKWHIDSNKQEYFQYPT